MTSDTGQLTFTLNELLEALTANGKGETANGDAFTTRQIKEATGWSLSYVADELRKLIDTGRAECVRIPITRIDGCRTTSPAYRLVKRVEET